MKKKKVSLLKGKGCVHLFVRNFQVSLIFLRKTCASGECLQKKLQLTRKPKWIACSITWAQHYFCAFRYTMSKKDFDTRLVALDQKPFFQHLIKLV